MPFVEFLQQNKTIFIEKNIRILIIIDEYQSIIDEYHHKGAECQFPEFLKILREQYSEIITVVLAGRPKLDELTIFNRAWVEQLGGLVFQIEVNSLTLHLKRLMNY